MSRSPEEDYDPKKGAYNQYLATPKKAQTIVQPSPFSGNRLMTVGNMAKFNGKSANSMKMASTPMISGPVSGTAIRIQAHRVGMGAGSNLSSAQSEYETAKALLSRLSSRHRDLAATMGDQAASKAIEQATHAFETAVAKFEAALSAYGK